MKERYGPWALITGASEGTGRCFARRLAAQGINLLLIARREAPLQQLVSEIRSEFKVECQGASIDLAAGDAGGRILAFAGVREVGLFINNAGGDTINARFLDRPVEQWMELVRLNALTMMQCCHHFGGQMRDRGRGGLLLVNSGACYAGATELTVYAASKGFMLNFSEGLWAELRPHNVDVLTLVLGQTDTPAFRKYIADKGLAFPENAASPEDVARVGLERLPYGPVHNWGHADDQAGFSPWSAAALRERILMIDAMRQQFLS